MSPTEEVRFASGDHELAGHLVRPVRGSGAAGVVIAHGFPSGVGGGANSSDTFPELAERISSELGWVALTFAASGCGESGGDFAIETWFNDQRAALDRLFAEPGVEHAWLLGFGTGGSLGVCVGALDERVRGVAAMAAPADFDDWASNPSELLVHARAIGAVTTAGYPSDLEEWAVGLKTRRAWIAASDLAPRELLVMHGSDDDLVPVLDARVIADAHESAELRIIEGAGHHLRHDPRAIAILLGWLDRQWTDLLV